MFLVCSPVEFAVASTPAFFPTAPCMVASKTASSLPRLAGFGVGHGFLRLLLEEFFVAESPADLDIALFPAEVKNLCQ